MRDIFQQELTEIPAREIIKSGKSKQFRATDTPGVAVVLPLNSLTAGNGKKSNVVVGKGELCNKIICRFFELLKYHGLPVAYLGPNGPRSYLVPIVEMPPYEIVVRFVARGAYVKSHPGVQEFDPLPVPVVELYLKTDGQQYKGIPLPHDDPKVTVKDGRCYLWLPDKPLEEQEPIAVIDLPFAEHIPAMKGVVLVSALICKRVLAKLGAHLHDLKGECGIDRSGRVYLADGISPDEFRLWYRDEEHSKQYFRDTYRNWRDDAKLLSLYATVEELTRRLISQ